MSHGEARGYTVTHPPFEAGNRVALRHGAYSPRSWRPLADSIAAELPEIAPWTTKATYAPSISAWARVEAQLVLVMDWLDEHGPLDDDGIPRPATTLQAKLEAAAQVLRSELGLSPLALARLISVAERRGSSSHDPARDELDRELHRLVAEGRAVIENVRDEVARLTERVVGGLEGGGADEHD